MDRFFNTVKIFVAGIFLCGMFLIGGKASVAEASQEDINTLRETLMQVSEQNDLVFHQDVFFIAPGFTGELDFRTITENGIYKVKGSLDLFMVDEKGNEERFVYPFYVTEDKDNSILYYQEDKKWWKTTFPINVSNALDDPKKSEAEEVEEVIAFVKDVSVLQDNDKKRTLLVKFDGVKIANALAKFADELKAELLTGDSKENPMNDVVFNEVMNCIDTGIKNADFWFTWTVDKTTWKTSTASFNLSGLSQSIAIAALDNPFISNNEGLRELFETIAFYSEIKGYTTFLNPTTKEKLEIPKEVLKAKESKSSSDDNSKSKKK